MRLLVDGLEQRALLGEEKNADDSEVSDPALDGESSCQCWSLKYG